MLLESGQTVVSIFERSYDRCRDDVVVINCPKYYESVEED